jgi:hypothetical protein
MRRSLDMQRSLRRPPMRRLKKDGTSGRASASSTQDQGRGGLLPVTASEIDPCSIRTSAQRKERLMGNLTVTERTSYYVQREVGVELDRKLAQLLDALDLPVPNELTTS